MHPCLQDGEMGEEVKAVVQLAEGVSTGTDQENKLIDPPIIDGNQLLFCSSNCRVPPLI